MKKRTAMIILGLVAALILLALVVWQGQREAKEEMFWEPAGLLFLQDKGLYVADQGSNAILCVQNGTIERAAGRTLAGANGASQGAYGDGDAEEAFFNQPTALASWLGGIVVSDTANHRLRLVKDGQVKTLAGTGVPGCHNGAANQATFYEPQGLAVGTDGNLYVADSENGCIRMLTPEGQVETVISGLQLPTGLCWNGADLYIADRGSHQILKWNGLELTVVAGHFAQDQEEQGAGFEDGPLAQASFRAPRALLMYKNALYVADTGNSAIRKIENGRVETVLAFGGTGSDLWPAQPTGLAVQGEMLYVADSFAGMVFTIELEKK